MDFKYKIVQHFGRLSTTEKGWSKELNLISWNGREPKYDIREWDATHEKMGKGITLTKQELDNLIDVYKSEFITTSREFIIADNKICFLGNPNMKVINNEFECISNLGDLFEIILKNYQKIFTQKIEKNELIQTSKVVSMLIYDLFGGKILSSNDILDYHYNIINGEYVDLLSEISKQCEENLDYKNSRNVERDSLNYDEKIATLYKLIVDKIYLEVD